MGGLNGFTKVIPYLSRSDIGIGGLMMNIVVILWIMAMLLPPLVAVGDAQSGVGETVEPSDNPSRVHSDLCQRNAIFDFLQNRGKIEFTLFEVAISSRKAWVFFVAYLGLGVCHIIEVAYECLDKNQESEEGSCIFFACLAAPSKYLKHAP